MGPDLRLHILKGTWKTKGRLRTLNLSEEAENVQSYVYDLIAVYNGFLTNYLDWLLPIRYYAMVFPPNTEPQASERACHMWLRNKRNETDQCL